jgi:hypothetical protein
MGSISRQRFRACRRKVAGMRFDVSVAHEACCTRISVTGDPTPGHLLSLLQVLEIDCSGWPRDAVLVDLRGLRFALTKQEQPQLAAEAARSLRRMRRIAVLGPTARRDDEGSIRFFDDADAALHWLAQG